MPAQNVPSPDVTPVRSVADLERVYDEILAPSFPVTELVARDVFVAEARDDRLDVLAARTDSGLAGAIVGSRHGAAVLVVWLAVGGVTRGAGTGSALVAAGLSRWLARPGVQIVLAEIERPDLFPAHPDHGDPARRLAFYARRGAGALAMPYYQPPVADGMPRVHGLLLSVLGAAVSAPLPRTLTLDETAAVRTFLVETMGEHDDAETRAVYAALDDPAGLRLVPLADYPRVPR
ncbi:hypothetical protein [Microbacterium sp. No. 7]|uniref:hypothetical protein n=1 Tax=Microbacterium sp. No. 7 TaxID=1714373 RepID=UPI0006D01F97|nr:hypothetical protein [Microbacterium sp. No. 7]ALJ20345.1 hypothetical protein AOA12_10645 [Microbacterium sp. No. 7]